jgi:hypothetical protein
MGTHRLKHSFSAGELSPLMQARLDFSRYNNGCNKLRNMVCTTQGPATRRPGFKYIYDLGDLDQSTTDTRTRLIPFIFNENQAYVMVFFVDSNDDVIMVLGDQEGLIVYSATPPTYCPPVPYTVAYTGTGSYNIPIDIDASSEVEVRHTAAGGTETVLTETTNYTITINTDPTADTINVTSGPTSTDGTLDFYLKGTGVTGEVVSLNLGPVVATDAVVGDGDTGWDIENFDWAQSADEMFFAQYSKTPHTIKRYGAECWELISLTFTDQPTEWSAANGWPERVTFHQQRIAFAASYLYRQTVWMSKAGDFYDFGVSAPLVDSDAITFTLDSGTQNKIVWMISAKSLNIGTIGNEWTVTGATRNALTPTNILAQRQTNNGGENNKPIMVGITTLFLEVHGKVINEFVYDYTYDSYKTSDMSVLSNHITKNYSITDWTYQQTPDSVIWSVRTDGALLGITYQRQHKVIGWHVHETDGEFQRITSIPGQNREDEVWAIVKRTINGSTVFYLEKMANEFKSDDSLYADFLDSSVLYNSTPTSSISGLSHLEGEVVNVLADGTVHPPCTVASGSITLNSSYSRVVVGLGFTSEIWPNLPDVPSQTGTALGRMQRITCLDIDLYNSLGMCVGRSSPEDGDSEEEIPFRYPYDVTGTRVPLYTGIYHWDFEEGFDRTSQYYIKQTQPLPLTVRAVVDTIEVYE